jgi:hypothetical protein
MGNMTAWYERRKGTKDKPSFDWKVLSLKGRLSLGDEVNVFV